MFTCSQQLYENSVYYYSFCDDDDVCCFVSRTCTTVRLNLSWNLMTAAELKNGKNCLCLVYQCYVTLIRRIEIIITFNALVLLIWLLEGHLIWEPQLQHEQEIARAIGFLGAN